MVGSRTWGPDLAGGEASFASGQLLLGRVRYHCLRPAKQCVNLVQSIGIIFRPLTILCATTT